FSSTPLRSASEAPTGAALRAPFGSHAKTIALSFFLDSASLRLGSAYRRGAARSLRVSCEDYRSFVFPRLRFAPPRKRLPARRCAPPSGLMRKLSLFRFSSTPLRSASEAPTRAPL